MRRQQGQPRWPCLNLGAATFIGYGQFRPLDDRPGPRMTGGYTPSSLWSDGQLGLTGLRELALNHDPARNKLIPSAHMCKFKLSTGGLLKSSRVVKSRGHRYFSHPFHGPRSGSRGASAHQSEELGNSALIAAEPISLSISRDHDPGCLLECVSLSSSAFEEEIQPLSSIP